MRGSMRLDLLYFVRDGKFTSSSAGTLGDGSIVSLSEIASSEVRGILLWK